MVLAIEKNPNWPQVVPFNFVVSYHTQPNFQDIATFIHMDEKKGLLYFDTTYWPYISNSSSLVPWRRRSNVTKF